MKKSEVSSARPKVASSTKSRIQYMKPRLKDYGQVGTLTRGGAASVLSDAGNNNMRP